MNILNAMLMVYSYKERKERKIERKKERRGREEERKKERKERKIEV